MRIDLLDIDRFDEVAPLFKSLVSHHRARRRHGLARPARRRRRGVAGAPSTRRGSPRVRTTLLGAPRMAWRGCSANACVTLHDRSPAPTWEIGDVVGELETLVVAEGTRGRGVGASLVEAAAQVCRDAGATHWLVGVAETNVDAVRFYERAGFKPYYRQLLGRL